MASAARRQPISTRSQHVIARIGDAAVALGPDLEALEVNPLWVRGADVEALDALAVWRET